MMRLKLLSNLENLNRNFKKTVALICSAVFLYSCVGGNLDRMGKLSFYNSLDKASFSFVVSDEFSKNNSDSKPSKEHPKMTEAEAKLLIKFLKNNNYCINKNGKLSFAIISKQEKIYDVTFSSVIEQHYNSRPVAPTTFFGECL